MTCLTQWFISIAMVPVGVKGVGPNIQVLFPNFPFYFCLSVCLSSPALTHMADLTDGRVSTDREFQHYRSSDPRSHRRPELLLTSQLISNLPSFLIISRPLLIKQSLKGSCVETLTMKSFRHYNEVKCSEIFSEMFVIFKG